MALLKCPECSGKVSTLASTCPHCGAPVRTELGTRDDVPPVLPGVGRDERPDTGGVDLGSAEAVLQIQRDVKQVISIFAYDLRRSRRWNKVFEVVSTIVGMIIWLAVGTGLSSYGVSDKWSWGIGLAVGCCIAAVCFGMGEHREHSWDRHSLVEAIARFDDHFPRGSQRRDAATCVLRDQDGLFQKDFDKACAVTRLRRRIEDEDQ